MGSWGEGPIENDTAADLVTDLLVADHDRKTIYEVVEEGLNSDDVDEQRLGAWLVAKLGYPLLYNNNVVKAHVELAIEKMKALLVDDWIMNWRNETAIRKSIQEQIDVLTELGIA